ncbi:MAG: hypothetical protein IT384_04530 [Deltaproteobacteria bacterium]|nr:hypothetical protein [Deltaproteobacteria bacterium]
MSEATAQSIQEINAAWRELQALVTHQPDVAEILGYLRLDKPYSWFDGNRRPPSDRTFQYRGNGTQGTAYINGLCLDDGALALSLEVCNHGGVGTNYWPIKAEEMENEPRLRQPGVIEDIRDALNLASEKVLELARWKAEKAGALKTPLKEVE